jgi:hypothetical protein
MTVEIWGVVAGSLLVVAAAASVLGRFRARQRWELMAGVARLLAACAVAAVLTITILARGEWSPLELQQVTLALIVAMLLVHAILAWRLGITGAGPVVDLVALALILVGAFWLQPGAMPLSCFQRAFPVQVQWGLSLLGAGSLLIAGSAGLMLALRWVLRRVREHVTLPIRKDQYRLLAHATFLALVSLGSGLTVGVWWAWQTVGMLTSGDLREAWLLIAWLVAAMSLLAWQLEERGGRWAAVLAVVAAAIVLFGLLVLPDLQYLVGI